MPKVLTIINRFNIGGQVPNPILITRYLPENYKTMIIGGEIEEGEDSSLYWAEELGLKPQIIKEMRRSISLSEDRKAFKKVVSIIKEFKPDIVHTHSAKAGAIGRLAAFKCNVPVVIHTYHGHVFHSYFGKIKTLIYLTIDRYLAKKSSAIIAITKEQNRELVEDYNLTKKEKVKTIMYGFDLIKFKTDYTEKRDLFRTKYNLNTDTIAIGIIGRLTDIKNHESFLNIVKSTLNFTQKNVCFFIIGDGELKTFLFDQCEKLNIPFSKDNEDLSSGSKLIFTSWIKDIDYALSGLDIVVLTSKNEGSPVTLIEAQANAKPVLSYNVGGVKDTLIDNETGFLIPKNDESSFVKQLLILIEDKNLRLKMGDNAQRFAFKNFSYQVMIDNIEHLYSNLLSNFVNKNN